MTTFLVAMGSVAFLFSAVMTVRIFYNEKRFNHELAMNARRHAIERAMGEKFWDKMKYQHPSERPKCDSCGDHMEFGVYIGYRQNYYIPEMWCVECLLGVSKLSKGSSGQWIRLP